MDLRLGRKMNMARPNLSESFNYGSKRLRWEPHRLVRDPPHRLEGRGVLWQAWNDVPMDMGELIAEQFVIDFDRLPFSSEEAGHSGDFFDQAGAVGPREVEEFSRVAFQHQYRPAGEELIIVKIGLRETTISDEMIRIGPGAQTGLAVRAGHGWLRVRPSSGVIRPFLINS